MFDDFDYWWPRSPKKVQGGIRSQTKKFGNQWWAERWLEVIEQFGPRRRVARGRSYARKGQVMDLTIEPGRISATVQGSRTIPYQVEILLEQLTGNTQSLILREIQTQPVYTATLLNGEVPSEFESVFRRHGVPLFPTREEGSTAACSCPDMGNPCKHIAAVYYLVSEALERDPFLLLQLRGLSRDQILPSPNSAVLHLEFPDEGNPPPADPKEFWKTPRVKEIPVSTPAASGNARAPILQRLGSFPFWRGESNFLEELERIYKAAKTTPEESETGKEKAEPTKL